LKQGEKEMGNGTVGMETGREGVGNGTKEVETEREKVGTFNSTDIMRKKKMERGRRKGWVME